MTHPHPFASKDSARDAWRARFTAEGRKTAVANKAPLKIVASADGESAEMMLYDEIGYWGVTAQEFNNALAGVTAKTITVRINSPGGDVFDGLAMFNALKAHPATVNTVVDGLAASAASFVALAGDTVTMGEASFMMIHNAWGFAVGNKADFTDMAKTLGKIDAQLAGIYAAKTGKPVADMAALMDGDVDGSWFTAQEAKDIGLIDAISSPDTTDPDGDDDAVANRVHRARARLRLASAT